MNEYYFGNFVIKHYDLYRLKSDNELKELNLFENNNDDILLIEWPEIIKKEPPSVIKLYFEICFEKTYIFWFRQNTMGLWNKLLRNTFRNL